jgi:hypothetical protein
MAAAVGGQQDAAVLLLKNGANVNVSDAEGQTPLIGVLRMYNRLLFQKITDTIGKTGLHKIEVNRVFEYYKFDN